MAVSSRNRAVWAAIALSFVVNAVPLANVHAGWLPLGVLWAGLFEPTPFSLGAVAVILILQAMAAAIFYFVLTGRRPWRWIVLAATVPVFFLVANWGLYYAVPRLILVGADNRPEIGELQRVCSAEGAALAQVHAGAGMTLEQAGEAWVILLGSMDRGLLKMPDCALTPSPAGRSGSTMDHVAAGGHVLYRTDAGLVYSGPRSGGPLLLEPPPGKRYWDPALAEDGEVVAWLDRIPVAGGPPRARLNLRHPLAGWERSVGLDLPAAYQIELIGAASVDGPFTLVIGRTEVVAVDGSGRVIRGPVSPPRIYNARWGFRWVADGWVCWDGYREDGPPHLAWSLRFGKGLIAIPRGRGIDSVAVDPSGRYVAVSVSTNLNIGGIKGALFVVRTSDGAEIYRRHLAPHHRARVAFLTPDYLAVDRPDGGRGVIDVFRMPAGAQE